MSGIIYDEVCPECGGPAFVEWGFNGADEYSFIYCPKCGLKKKTFKQLLEMVKSQPKKSNKWLGL
jgi:uncharacterized Zn finger protein (UPF0148 family)